MIYKYKCGDMIIRVFVWNNDFQNKVSVEDTKTKNIYNRTIREDSNGKFFTWNRKKIYITNWIKISMKEVKKKIENEENVTSDDLCQAIMSDGIENARFIVPLNTTSCFGFFANGNDFKNTLCKIEERYNRKVKQNYKIVFVPLVPNKNIISSVEYYVDDLILLIQSGCIKIVV